MKETNKYEVIIIGGSYSGLAAAMALGRSLRKVLIIDSGNPCNRQTPYSHNFLTRDGQTPREISELARQEVEKYSTVTFKKGLITHGSKSASGFDIQADGGETYYTKKLIFATGISDILPEIPGLSNCWGISVLHCPYCHGYEARHTKTGILGNGEYGFEFSLLISNWTGDLTLYTNGISTLSKPQTEILHKKNIKINESEVAELEHKEGYLYQILFKDGSKEAVKTLYTRPPFVQQCILPENLGCEITGDGYIKVDAAQKTLVPGIYACGDNCTRLRTVANAVSMGTTAGMMVNKELIEEQTALLL